MKHLILLSSFLLIAALSFGQTRCKGIKADGTQCKMTKVNAAGYCRFHDPNARHCSFIKKNGERCKMVIKEGETYCSFHKNK